LQCFSLFLKPENCLLRNTDTVSLEGLPGRGYFGYACTNSRETHNPLPTLNWIGKDAVINHHKEVPFRLLKCRADLSVSDPDSGNLLVQPKLQNQKRK
jgi:hypothetical protein